MTRRLANNRSPRWAFMERFEVPDYDQPERNHLTRWRIIQTPWFGIYLHRMDGPDPRTTLHDHPWSFVSFPLRGGYDEVQTYTLPLGRVIRRVNVKRATDTHYIVRLHRVPTWTLMFVGRRRRTWGYIDRDGTWTAFDRHPHNDEFNQAMAWREDHRVTDRLHALAAWVLYDLCVLAFALGLYGLVTAGERVAFVAWLAVIAAPCGAAIAWAHLYELNHREDTDDGD